MAKSFGSLFDLIIFSLNLDRVWINDANEPSKYWNYPYMEE